ncbi:MAG: N-acetyltransferase family protein, partial [Candidatus Hermodarchaeia archaeon]
EFQICPIDQFTNDELQAPFFVMFDNNKDRFWLDQTPDQRKECFTFWFDRERPFIDEATGVLLKDNEIIGLTVVRPIQEVGMLGPIAVTPEFRRQGLGRALMAYSFHGALKTGFMKIQLEFDITNEPALQLYTELGFTHVHRLVIFAISF